MELARQFLKDAESGRVRAATLIQVDREGEAEYFVSGALADSVHALWRLVCRLKSRLDAQLAR